MTSTEIIWAIQSKRMTLGLSRRTLSLRSGVNEKTIEKIEQVTERKTMDNLIALCNAMGLEIRIDAVIVHTKIISDAWDAGARWATMDNGRRFGYSFGGNTIMNKEEWMRAHNVHTDTDESA